MAVLLQRVALELSAEWRHREYTTDPPRYVPHLEWDLWIRVMSAVPVRCAAVLRRQEDLLWALVGWEPQSDLELRMRFAPHAWSSSDAVHVGFEGPEVLVTDSALKADPRSSVELGLPATARTGEFIAVANVPAHGLEFGMIAFAESDTEKRRMNRWRVKPAFLDDLPPGLAGLASGHRHGRETPSCPPVAGDGLEDG